MAKIRNHVREKREGRTGSRRRAGGEKEERLGQERAGNLKTQTMDKKKRQKEHPLRSLLGNEDIRPE